MDTSLLKSAILLKRYEENSKAKGLSPLSIVNYLCDTRAFLRYLEEEEKIEDLKTVDKKTISRYQTYLYSHPRGYSLRTQSKKLQGLKHFFRFLESEDLLLSDPTTLLKLPKIPKELPLNTPSEKEIKKLLNSIDLDAWLGLRDRAILEILYSTGIRSGELMNLKMDSIDREDKLLKIYKGKGGKDRVVPAGETAIHYLGLYLQNERSKFVKKEGETRVFLTSRGNPMKSENIADILRRWVKHACLTKPIRPHMLRHAMATHMLRHNAPIRHIQEILGHASLGTTQLYTKVEITDLQRVHRRTHPRERA